MRDPGFGQDAAFGQDSAYGIGWGGSRPAASPAGSRDGAADGDGDWGRAAGRSAAPWEERAPQDPFYPDLGGSGLTAPGSGSPAPAQSALDYGAPQHGAPQPGAPEYGAPDYSAPDYSAPEYGAPDYGAGQGYAGQDYASRDYAGQYGGQPEPGQPGADRREGDRTARMDPALQDFFAPQADRGPAYEDPWAEGPRGGTGYRPADDGWSDGGRAPGARPPAGRGATGPQALRGGFDDDDDERRGLGTRGYIAIGAVVAVIIVVAVVVFTRGSGSTPPAASNGPTSSTSAVPTSQSVAASGSGSAASPSASAPAAGGAAAGTAYKLSTPATAGGYPKGTDPHFLATATSTAGQITAAVTAGNAGAITGDAKSAAYKLPVNGQVVTFVGYQGTFNPAKVATVLATLGSDYHSHAAGSHGGDLGCINTKPSAGVTSGAVCVWATGSTLGVTEFFSSTGPEALTASQDKGATDTVNIRGDVEAKA